MDNGYRLTYFPRDENMDFDFQLAYFPRDGNMDLDFELAYFTCGENMNNDFELAYFPRDEVSSWRTSLGAETINTSMCTDTVQHHNCMSVEQERHYHYK